jgi:hypothetical protein
MRVDAAQTPEAARSAAHPFEVRKDDPERIPDGDILDVSTPADQGTDLAADLEGDLGDAARELLRNQAVARYAALVELPELAELAGLETVRLSV